jgi:hypothetical protein
VGILGVPADRLWLLLDCCLDQCCRVLNLDLHFVGFEGGFDGSGADVYGGFFGDFSKRLFVHTINTLVGHHLLDWSLSFSIFRL